MGYSWWRSFIFTHFTQKHSEISLYVVALLFLVTYFINPSFKNFILDTTLVDAAGWLFVQLYLGGLFLVSLTAVLIPKELKWYRSLAAPLLLLISSLFLLFAYLQTFLADSEVGLINLFFVFYHLLVMYVLFENYFHHEPINDRVISPRQATLKEVLIASVLAPAILVSLYLLFDFDANWAIPISTAILFWSLFDRS